MALARALLPEWEDGSGWLSAAMNASQRKSSHVSLTKIERPQGDDVWVMVCTNYQNGGAVPENRYTDVYFSQSYQRLVKLCDVYIP